MKDEEITMQEWELAENSESIIRCVISGMSNIDRTHGADTRRTVKNDVKNAIESLKKLERLL